jgi:predicted DNA-binding transcriptional regulator AlpA
MTNHLDLSATGFLRLASILAPRGPIPVSKSTWWAGVKSGRFPKPVKLGPRITAWRVEEIRALIDYSPLDQEGRPTGFHRTPSALDPWRRPRLLSETAARSRAAQMRTSAVLLLEVSGAAIAGWRDG